MGARLGVKCMDPTFKECTPAKLQQLWQVLDPAGCTA